MFVRRAQRVLMPLLICGALIAPVAACADSVAEAAASLTLPVYPELPTAVGFQVVPVNCFT